MMMTDDDNDGDNDRIMMMIMKTFTYLPISNAGDAIGDKSTLKNSWPSFGRF